MSKEKTETVETDTPIEPQEMRPVVPAVDVEYTHVDRRAEIVDLADKKFPNLKHSWKKGTVSAQELFEHRMRIVTMKELYGKDAPDSPVSHRGDLLACKDRDETIGDIISREKLSERRVERSMKSLSNEDRKKWAPRRMTSKPKSPADIGVPDN